MSSSSLPSVSTTSSHRSRSVRSVASNSSIASGASLTRQPRIRTRSRTVTGSVVERPEDQPTSPVSELPYLDREPLEEPARDSPLSSQSSSSLLLISRPLPSSEYLDPHVVGSSRSQTSQEADSAAGEATLVTPLPQQSPMPVKLSKAAKQASQLASIETSYKPLPSAFSRDPDLTPNARDSFSTNKSGTSSSFYPPSTSTVSAPNSPPSPRTVAEEISQPNISLLAEEVGAMQEYDGDDVAYRLRLLVNNNYFLPPAHMKPSPEDFAASVNARKPPKQATPAFLDIFRVGKSKTKPTTPVTPGFSGGPMLRTTADSITPSFALRTRAHSPQLPHLSAHPSNGVRDRGRVVVVKERMHDIAVAAKQAEHEMKTRKAKRGQGSDRTKQQEAGDVIDPTDVVDVPLPSSSYPFAVQASALHGLGVQDSVGAAVLADRLPPNSPGMSSSYEADDHWRKALLQEAVYHSLDNTPDISTFSHIGGDSTLLPNLQRINGESSRGPTPGLRAERLQQHITDQPSGIEVDRGPKNNNSKRKSTQSQASAIKAAGKFLATPESNDSRRSSYLPTRMTTPLGNLTPLSPAPRKQIMNATYSISQTDLQQALQDADSRVSSKSRLRRSVSTPMLSEVFDGMRHEFVMTPPPPLPATRRSSQMTTFTQSFETSRDRPSMISVSSQSQFDIDDTERLQRESVASSATASRPSLSSYSQNSISPTTSAFQDALNHPGDHSAVTSVRQSVEHMSSVGHASVEEEPRTRSSLTSPPPRPSTSIAHIALRPPPRSSSFNYAGSSLQSSVTSPLARSIVAEPAAEASVPSAPAPLPAFSYGLPTRRGGNAIPLILEIPRDNTTVAIHSPAPSSPTSFFDTLQAQHSAMDDLDSSDESDEEEEDDDDDEEDTAQSRAPESGPPPFIIDPRARANSTVSRSPIRPSIMRLGNFSTPYINRANERSRNLPIGVLHSKKALGFTPAKTQFFTDKKSDLGHGSELTTFLAQGQIRARATSGGVVGAVNTTAGSSSLVRVVEVNTDVNVNNDGLEKRRPATAGQVGTALPSDRKPESLKLDGMLVQHMEAEKDRIRKIASTLKSGVGSGPS